MDALEARMAQIEAFQASGSGDNAVHTLQHHMLADLRVLRAILARENRERKLMSEQLQNVALAFCSSITCHSFIYFFSFLKKMPL
jgi:hypothetical protein